MVTKQTKRRLSFLDKLKADEAEALNPEHLANPLDAINREDDPKPGTTERRPPSTAPGRTLMMGLNKVLQDRQAGDPVALSLIDPNPYQPRLMFDSDALQELADNIRLQGLQQPILVRINPQDPDRFQIIAGERRLRAHKLLGKEDIRVIIQDYDDDQTALAALTENVQRENLTDFEIYHFVEKMKDRIPVTHLAEKLGMSRAHFYRYLAFRHLPDYVLNDLRDRPNLIGATTAGALGSILEANKETATEHLKPLWEQLKQGKLLQTRLPNKLKTTLDEKLRDSPQSVTKLYAKGQMLGALKRNHKGITLTLSEKFSSEELESDIKAFLREKFPELGD